MRQERPQCNTSNHRRGGRRGTPRLRVAGGERVDEGQTRAVAETEDDDSRRRAENESQSRTERDETGPQRETERDRGGQRLQERRR